MSTFQEKVGVFKGFSRSEKSLIAAFALAVGVVVGYTGIKVAKFTAPVWATDKVGATEVLKDNGLTPVKVGGYAWFQCGDDDTYATKFSAVNKEGKPVDGAVCKGLFFKGSTIRFQ